jgi:hypothetical protein
MEQNYLEMAFRKSKIYYYQVFVEALVLLLLGSLYDRYSTFIVPQTVTTVICSIDYLVLLCGLPWVLWMFNKKIKALAEEKDSEKRYETYLKWVKIRIIIIGGSFLLNVALFYFLRDRQVLFAAAIAACAMLFCKPKRDVVDREMNPLTEIDAE